MPEASTFKKARIVDANDPSKSVECHFNPATFQVTQTVAWKEHTTIGRDAPELSFAGGQGGDLNVELLFDTTATGADVRQAYRLLLDLAKIDQTRKNTKTGKGEPRLCRFEWGNFLSFDAVITNITQTFTLFNSDGTPLRAKVGVRFKQVDQPVRGQNPTSRSQARKSRVVHEGETLDWIAFQEYGDSACWHHIAETNDLADPMHLVPGQVLKLVPLP